MKYFLPDSQDLVDPSFDFETERRSATRARQHDDEYAHELFRERAFDGYLVSKGIVDGFSVTGSRYTLAQRHRLLRQGVRDFFRLEDCRWGAIPVMGDCGAFTYVNEPAPPYSAEEVLRFYVEGGFDLGISVDHVILEYRPEWDQEGAPDAVIERQRITLGLAEQFLNLCKRHKVKMTPLGVAQGWSPSSYATSLTALQKMGYRYVAVGGMVPLKTPEILASLQAMAKIRRKDTQLHLLGVTRVESIAEFSAYGVTSFDSTSPLRQAFKDDKRNYYTPDTEFTAIRVPQVQGNARLQKAIGAGLIDQGKARTLERSALAALKGYASRTVSLEEALAAVRDYEAVWSQSANTRRGSNYEDLYRTTLEARPWEACRCDVCRDIGHHVVIFRGAERNRRRGLHNTWTFYRRLQRVLPAVLPHRIRVGEKP